MSKSFSLNPLSYIKKATVRNKLILTIGFVTMIFLGAIAFSLVTSQNIRDSSDETFVFAKQRALSYSVSLDFQEQLTYVRSYTLGIIPVGVTDSSKVHFNTLFGANIAAINTAMNGLDDINDPGTNGQVIIDSIQLQRPTWINSAQNIVMSIPDTQILNELELLLADLEHDFYAPLAAAQSYITSGDQQFLTELNDLKTHILAERSEVYSVIAKVEPVNASTFLHLSTNFDTFVAAYDTWSDNVIGSAILLGDSHADIVANGSTSMWTDWVDTKGDLHQTTLGLLTPFKTQVDGDFKLSHDYLVLAEGYLAPILDDLSSLRDFAESEIAAQQQNSADLADAGLLFSLIAASIAIVIAILVILYISALIAVPLGKLTEHASRMAAGDLSQNVVVEEGRKDEIGILQSQFAEMGSNIRTLVQDITLSVNMVGGYIEQLQLASSEVSEMSLEVSHSMGEINQGMSLQAEQNSQVSELMMTHTEVVINMSDQVQETLDVIREINEEVTFIALNAQIESARVGAVGRGFMVVASSIRDLAQKSKTQMKDIGGRLGAIRESVSDSVEKVQFNVETLSSSSEEIAAISDHSASSLGNQVEVFTDMNSVVKKIFKLTDQLIESTKAFNLEDSVEKSN